MSGKPKTPTPKPIPDAVVTPPPRVVLTTTEAWDLRGVADACQPHHQALARHQADFERIAREACERAGVEFNPRMQVHVEDGEVVLR